MSHVDEGTLHAYLDGELPPGGGERAALDAHIAQCVACRAQLVGERALRERASALLGAARPAERPVPPFEQVRRAPRRSPWHVRTSLAWAASIALALGLGYYLRDLGMSRAAPRTLSGPAVIAHRDEVQNRAVAPARAAASNATQPAAAAQEEGERDRRSYGQRQLYTGRAESSAMKVALRPAPRAAPPSTVAAAPSLPDSVSAVADVATDVPPAVQAGLQRQVLTERKASANTWPRIDRETAKAILGEDPVGLPDLTTRTFRRSPDRDGVVVVEQQLDDRTVIEIFQQQSSRASSRLDSLVAGGYAYSRGLERERADRLARFVGKLRVEIGGPVSVDSLNRLLEQVVPLP